jgi:hypothetical protein
VGRKATDLNPGGGDKVAGLPGGNGSLCWLHLAWQKKMQTNGGKILLKLQSTVQESLKPIYSFFKAHSLSKKAQSSVLSPQHLCFLLIALLIALLSMPFSAADAAQVELTWEPSAGSATGYKVHYGGSSRNYDHSVDVGNSTGCNISGLQEGETYYFAATAYDAVAESNFSEELVYTIPVGASSEASFPYSDRQVIEAEQMSYHANGAQTGDYWNLWSNGTMNEDVYFPDSGTYLIEITAKGALANGVGPEMQLRIDGQSKGSVFVNTNSPEIYTFEVEVSAGTHEVSIAFNNDYYDPARGVDRNLYVDKIAVVSYPNGDTDGGGTESRLYEILEFGEVQIDHDWQYVVFNKSFIDPIVVAKSMSKNGGDPAVIRIRDVDENGFEIKVQEWDYLDGPHALETVGYLVVERGSHSLEDGTKVEAGSFNTNKVDSFGLLSFNKSFQDVPVVISSISSFNGSDAVTGRLRNISTNGFEFCMQEQESFSDVHTTESISYIAWEPSSGSIDGLTYEIGKTGSVVNQNFHTIQFTKNYTRSPLFLADMQTADGIDTANVRWQNKNQDSVQVQIDEEQSVDSEIEHTNENVGYLIFVFD